MGDGIDDDVIVEFFEDDSKGTMLKGGASGVLRQGTADDLFAVNQLDRSVEDFLTATGDFLLPCRFDVHYLCHMPYYSTKLGGGGTNSHRFVL